MKFEWKSKKDEYGCKTEKLYFNDVEVIEIIEFDDGEIELFGNLIKVLDFKSKLFVDMQEAKQFTEDTIREFAVEFSTWYMR